MQQSTNVFLVVIALSAMIAVFIAIITIWRRDERIQALELRCKELSSQCNVYRMDARNMSLKMHRQSLLLSHFAARSNSRPLPTMAMDDDEEEEDPCLSPRVTDLSLCETQPVSVYPPFCLN